MLHLYCDCIINLDFRILILQNIHYHFILILFNDYYKYCQINLHFHFDYLDYIHFNLFLNLLLNQVHFFIYHKLFAFLAL